MYLEKINGPEDVKKIKIDELPVLAQEIRLDEALLTKLKQNHDTVITLEDGILDGGFGEKIARFYGASNMKVMNYGLKKEFLDRYDVDAVLKDNHLTAEQIVEDVLSIS